MTAAEIPFREEAGAEYGVARRVSPLVRRVVCDNPSSFTYHGTNSYIVGAGTVAVIDPGPDDGRHVEAIAAAVKGEEVSHILVTHTHTDHSPATRALKDLVGAPIVGMIAAPIEDGARTVEAGDPDFAPDVVLGDGDTFSGDGWTLQAVFTPGHMSNHHCFALAEESTLFSGDHVMGWNTTIVSPPHGNMKAYLDSLKICIARDDGTYLPGHGPAIEDPKPFVRAYLTHRMMREGEIMRCLGDGVGRIPDMVRRMYKHLPEQMHGAASRSVFAHLEHMVETGRVACDGKPGAESDYRLP
jgi:glyoxylase-like metal-dependent hydrolase (beta-lactamase superfamily II)